MKEILVAGGAGYIGSHFVNILQQNPNYKAIVVDSLIKGHKEAIEDVEFYNIDLSNKDELAKLFEKHNFFAVVHFASYIEVGESVKNPGEYYTNNVCNTVNLLNTMVEFGVKHIVFSSTAAVYGEPIYTPIDEEHPKAPINPYGSSKLMVENIMEDFSKAYDFSYVALRYFNACGADFSGVIGESHSPESHLIPLVLQSIKGDRESISIFGTNYETPDGSCVRDYVHVNDLADAHIKAVNYLEAGGKSISLNLGTGKGTSVKEIIDTCEKVTGKKAPVVIGERRAGDPSFLYAKPDLAKSVLGWEAKITNIEEIISSSWNWELNKKY